jgi:MFS family permease
MSTQLSFEHNDESSNSFLDSSNETHWNLSNEIEKQSDNNDSSSLSPSKEPSPPPNGGLIAWLQVLGGFFAYFNSWGIVNTFGTFQLYYSSGGLAGETNSSISWIGSVQGLLVVSGSLFVGRLLDAGYVRPMLFAGTFLLSFGLMMTSLSTEFYQVFLAQGICLGLGSTLLFVSAVGTVGPYFSTKKALAVGFVSAGSSVGGVVYPIMVNKLIAEVGYPWAARIFGFVVLVTNLVPCILMKSRLPARKSGPLIDYASLKDKVFVLYTFAMFFEFLAIYIPLFYISTYAAAQGLNYELAFYVLPIMNAASIAGRLLPNLIADRVGPFNIMAPCTIATAVLTFGWMGIFNEASVIVFCILFGFFSGAFLSLFAVCIGSMTKDITIVGTRLGMTLFVAGFGILIGTPIAGALITIDFFYAKLFSAIAAALSALFVVLARFSLTGGQFLVKV